MAGVDNRRQSPLSTVPLSLLVRFTGTASLALVSAATRAAEGEAPGISGATIVQMLVGLTVIIGILFAAAYLLRQLNGGQRFGHGGPLRIIGGLMISARERIVVVEIGETWLVVGIVPGQIKTLHTLAKGELPATVGDKPFSQWLRQMSERRK